jgi:hypothetical protein
MAQIKMNVSEETRRRFKSYAAKRGMQYPGALELLLDLADKIEKTS